MLWHKRNKTPCVLTLQLLIIQNNFLLLALKVLDLTFSSLSVREAGFNPEICWLSGGSAGDRHLLFLNSCLETSGNLPPRFRRRILVWEGNSKPSELTQNFLIKLYATTGLCLEQTEGSMRMKYCFCQHCRIRCEILYISDTSVEWHTHSQGRGDSPRRLLIISSPPDCELNGERDQNRILQRRKGMRRLIWECIWI